MKNIAGLIAINTAIAALLTSSAALATGPHAGGAGSTGSAGGVGTVSAGTAVAGSFAVRNNGTSTSYAQNTESAKATITATKSYTPANGSVTAGVQGATKTESAGVAYNMSTGSGSGHALSAGYADTATHGTIGIRGVTFGFNGGGSGTHTDNLIKAGTNQGSYVLGETVSGFDAQVDYSRAYSSAPAPAGSYGGSRSGTVEVTGSSSGYASGANKSGALENMNAAGFTNIGSSGYFFGKTNLSGSTGYKAAP
jgi:hypothetical protein